MELVLGVEVVLVFTWGRFGFVNLIVFVIELVGVR